jgi:nucleoside phosphorylase
MSRQLRLEEYTVGWVCALPIELAAAQEMLDEEHENLHHDPDDTNIYTLGRIGEHNVVIACLPEGQTGTNSAAAVAVQMKSSFKSIRFGLMVGIGGGVPSEEADIRLGDVVVSRPQKIHGGVVQYDFGKATPSGFERTGFLNTPPTILLNALANLQANHVRGRSRLLEYVSKLERLPTFTRGDAGPDILFEASYNHKGGATCGDCSKEKVVARQTCRQEIAIHYGTIASGNQVMRDAAERDRVSAELGGVLCFEMEAAGLMNSFPYLVIRGICDYADSHKNKRWQAFAAGTAAAYTKEVLSVIPPADVAKTRPHSADLTEFSKSFSLAEYDRQIAKLPYAEDAAFDSMLWEQKPQCLPGTRVLLRRQIEAWSKDPHSTPIFWLKGMAGTGKSTIARTVSRSFAEQKRLGASFFFSKGRGDLGNAKKFITTIATQLAGTIPSLRRHISGVMSENPQIIRRGLTEQWKDLVLQPLSSLTDAVLQARSFVIVIDALDECDSEDDVRLVLRLLAETKAIKGTLLRIFITSRSETPIRLGFRKMPEGAYQDFALHDVDEAIIQHDVTLFLSCELENVRKDHNIDQGWPSKHSTELLAQHAKGLFIYAATACRFIRNSKPFVPEDRLSQLLQGSTASRSPAAELDRIYSQILQYCVIGDSDSQEKGELARKFKEVVGSIVVLYDTLDSAALAELIDVPEQRIFAVLGDLHSVLDVPGNGDHPIQLLHPSFRDFLLDPGRCADTDFRVQEKSIHQALYFGCVKLLSKHLRKDICDLKRPGTLAAEVGKVEVNKHISSQVQYACHYWVDHLKHSGIALYDNDEAHVFLQQHFLHWLETLSLIGGMSEVVLMVRILESILIVRTS